MTIDNKLKIIFGITSVALLSTLIIKLKYVPGGMILSGLFLGNVAGSNSYGLSGIVRYLEISI